MLPPETMHGDLAAAGPAGERDRRRERAGALGDHAHALGEQPNGVGRLVERDDERAVERVAHVRPHRRRARRVEPAPSTNDGVYSTSTGSPAANAAAQPPAPVSGSTP